MSQFKVRVELHQAAFDVYERLHQKLLVAGYQRLIVASDGSVYQLPTATYSQNFGPNFTAEQIRGHVAPIVQSVWRTFSLFVVRYDEAAWSGLTMVSRKVA